MQIYLDIPTGTPHISVMDRAPDRVSLDLSRHMREQDAAELRFEQAKEQIEWDAEEALRDPEKLKRVLNDTELAQPLAVAFDNYERAVEEMAGKEMPATAAILAVVGRIRKQAFQWLKEDA